MHCSVQSKSLTPTCVAIVFSTWRQQAKLHEITELYNGLIMAQYY